MKCEGIDKLIYLFLDGRLSQDEERKLKEHLSRCERCASKLALLESVEGGARGIEIKEPSPEYWNSFSSRVREKISERKRKSVIFDLKNVLKSIFSFSPLKIKVAAGLVSIVLVFIVGKFYVDYQKQEILPPKKVETESRQLDVMEGERKKGFPTEETQQAIGAISESDKGKIESEAPVSPESKGIPAEGAGGEKAIVEKKKVPPAQPKVIDEKPAPAYAPALPIETPVEAEKSSEQATAPAAVEQRGAGTEKQHAETLDKLIYNEQKPIEVEGFTAEGKGERPQMKDVTASVRTKSTSEFYVVNKNAIPKMEEEDTLIQKQQLIRVIETWKLYIKENPADSLSREGYLQIATAYYLLSKLTQDTTIISEGSELIQGYLDQIEDQKIKEELNTKLEKIKALKER